MSKSISDELKLEATQYRDVQMNEFTQVTASCKCGRGGWIRLPKHYIADQSISDDPKPPIGYVRCPDNVECQHCDFFYPERKVKNE